ncbi:MAG: adenosine-specific kinase [Planctomycetia bacterium]|uniref:Adenosine monophosphate-protein transferase n=1 Tax=Candidatus Brocadia sapporoensis TaxID=392547 RepID=A0A1V6LXN4_9BACT|nr:adenosine-specific kinase [Candidatus Brocadia sapporoensis]MDG6006210.1 adenosine monophosphate-protein transferase [Candidatus Brocadia sp.]OQZ05112.1 MAG: adenosine monophosphate-protein transferase [Candidatus Brocadia sp. UTAMX1]QOJ07899.1 MAG: adenosine-specific kinase [Planctomycetia bacterium]RZV58152.1 MAG: adenosine monophosphate-protein transferase [Candidatus Brocadia sp. BROELEC01]TVL94992.1 MAG: adenosine monophosphate-protein transferase [Candidatus Brocadia sp. BL1]
MEIKPVTMEIPEGANIIIGQAHFIKTVEDLYEVLINAVPGTKFGIAFCEASGPRLVRAEGNDATLRETAIQNARTIAAGHTFVVIIKEAFPVNVLNAVKACPEVCTIFCATANPVQVIVAETEQGRGVLGVVDGYSPKGVEGEKDIQNRRQFLRKIGYKF